MDDFFDDFDSDYNEGEFMDDDPIEEPSNCDFESDDLFNLDAQIEHNLLDDDNENGISILRIHSSSVELWGLLMKLDSMNGNGKVC